ncbi:hypothetical protein C8255_20700 [filamentous cyanobacterium CCP3]|nr:hypothetical protein C8255_20700 [filamentous cyanobacterium CCP3]
MPDVSPSEINRHNQQALDELCRLLRFSQGEFELILAVCNSTRQRHELVEQLRQQCSIAFAEMTLDPSTTTLFTTIRNHIGSPPPEALMVYGMDGVQDQQQLLAATNQIREEFRQFPFPLVLWLTDDSLKHLIRTAPDFYTWANSITFATPPEFFLAFLDELIADVWRQVVESRENRFLSNAELGLTPGSARCRELDTSLAILANENIELSPPQSAALAFVQGRIADNNTLEAREHYERSLAQWQALLAQNGQELHRDWQENVGYAQFYLGLWWGNYAVRHQSEFQAACDRAREFCELAVETFEAVNRPDLAAKYINYLALALHRLERWDKLATVAAKALSLHQAQQVGFRMARAKGFLAEVALNKEDWLTAQSEANDALSLIDSLAESSLSPIKPLTETTLDLTSSDNVAFFAWVNSFHRSWYLFSLGKAQMGQGQVDAAVQTLEQIAAITQPEYDPQLYSQTLEYLRQGYFEQGHYLQAFETRREKEAIESRFNFRAFVGAGRLQPKQQITNPALPTGDNGPDLIMASGRKHDVRRLFTRLAQDEFVLTVVYGPSGVGKSSLIEAGLVPTLEQQRFGGRRVVPVRLWSYSTWATDLLHVLPSWEGPGVGQTLDVENAIGTEAVPTPPFGHPSEEGRVLAVLRQQTQRNRVMVLIFDQFEEFFFACEQPGDRLRFYTFLRDCLSTPFVKVILSLREDYTHYLLECNRLTDLAIIDNNILDKKWLYYLGNFSPEDARGVIDDLTQPTPYAPAPELVERVVADLAAETGDVRPIELQIVGSQLQAEGIDTLAAYQGWPHSETSIKAALVQQYLNDVVQDCGPVAHQQLANLVLYLLTDDKGTRPRKSKSELANELQALTAQAAMDMAPFGLVLQVLTESGLVVHLPEAPEDRYQLVHDYLAAFIHQQQTPQLEALMAELEEEKRRRQLVEALVAELEEEKRQRQLTEVENEELTFANHKARRRLLFSSGLLAASLVGVLIAVPSAVSALRVAREETAKASKAQQDAEGAHQAQVEADLARQDAERAVEKAVERQRQADKAAREALEQAEVAQAAVKAAKNAEGVALTQQQAAQRQADAAQRTATAADKLRALAVKQVQDAQNRFKEAERQQEIAREGTQLEQRGTALLRLRDSRFRQAETLIAALQLGYNLKAILSEANIQSNTLSLVSYPAYSPLLVLRVITNTNTLTHEGQFRSFTPNEQGLITQSSSESKSYLWSLNGTKQASFEGTFLDFTPDGQGLITFSSNEGKSHLWSLIGTKRASFEGEFLGFTPDGQGLITLSSRENKSHLWSLDGTKQGSYEGTFLNFTPNGQDLVIYSDKSRLLSLNGQEQANYEGVFLGFTPDGQGLITLSSRENKSDLWSLDGTKQGSYEGAFQDFTPNGQGLIVYSYIDRKIRFLSLDGTELASYEGEFRGVSPDEQGLVTYSKVNNEIRLLSLDGTEQASYKGDFRGFTPDGKALYIDSESGTTLWSLSGELLAEFTGRMTPNFSGDFDSFSDDGQYLITSLDNTTRIWRLDNGLDDLLARGCNLLESYFTTNPDQREALKICLD